jgi:hypothetical protein
METKSVGQAIARVLRSSACRKIDFYVGSFHVDSAGFELVAKALDTGKIKVVIYEELADGAAYSEKLNVIGVASADVCTTALGRSLVVHEAVHALYDLRKLSFDPATGEATSYISGALFESYTLREFLGGVGGAAFAATGGARGSVGKTVSRAIGISRVYASKPASGSSAIGVSRVGGSAEDQYIDKGAVAIHQAAFEAAATVFDRPAATVSDTLVKKLRATILAHEIYAHLKDKHGHVKKNRTDGV